jgi:uncharacterized protein with PIN domain
MSDETKVSLLCCRCNVPLVKSKSVLTYQGQKLTYDLDRCPRCGQIYIPEDLAIGKMAEVEYSIEEK